MYVLSIRHFKNPYVALFLSLWLLGLLIFPTIATAAMAPSKTSSCGVIVERQTDIQTVRSILEHKIVAQKLKDHGMSREQTESKLQLMSDAEVHQIALLSKKLPKGGKYDDYDTDNRIWYWIVVLIILYLLYRWATSSSGTTESNAFQTGR